jgi:hypothetical protein
MLLYNNAHKESVKITLAVKVYADGDVSRSMFDDLLGEDALAKTGETTVRSSMIKNLGLDFSYNEKNYKSAISDLYHQLEDFYKEADILDYCNAIDDNSILVKIYVRDDDNTKVNVGQVRVIEVLFAVDKYDTDDAVKEVVNRIITTFDFNGIYVDYDEDFIGIITREI